MAPTAITVQTIKGPFEAITANGADITFAAGDVANGNKFTCTGREVLIAYNSDGVSAYTVTVTSVDDEYGRSEDITTYSLAAGEYAAFGVGLTNSQGWKQTDGTILVSASNVAVQFAVLRLPA